MTRAYTANNLNQYTEIDSVEFEYDADGNLLDDGQFNYEYDALNQLIAVSNATAREVFVYDFMGRRIATESYFKSGSSWIQTTRRRYIYQGWNVIAEFVNGVRSKTYVWGEDLSGELQGAGGVGGLLLEKNSNGEYLPVYDGNGNIIAYKSADNGNVVATYSYDPFGNVIAHTGMDFTYKFSTKPQDELTGLYYYGYRFYQPEVGRWINRDPIRENDAWNLYAYVSGNSINFIDNLGNFPQAITMVGLSVGVKAALATLAWFAAKLIFEGLYYYLSTETEETTTLLDTNRLVPTRKRDKREGQCDCALRDHGKCPPPSTCPSFVRAYGRNSSECQKTAKLMVEEKCRKHVGHCQFRPPESLP